MELSRETIAAATKKKRREETTTTKKKKEEEEEKCRSRCRRVSGFAVLDAW